MDDGEGLYLRRWQGELKVTQCERQRSHYSEQSLCCFSYRKTFPLFGADMPLCGISASTLFPSNDISDIAAQPLGRRFAAPEGLSADVRGKKKAWGKPDCSRCDAKARPPCADFVGAGRARPFARCVLCVYLR